MATFEEWLATAPVRIVDDDDGVRYVSTDQDYIDSRDGSNRLTLDQLYQMYARSLAPADLSGVVLADKRSGIRTNDYEAGADTSDPQQDYLHDLRQLGYMPTAGINWDAPFQQNQGDYKVPFSGTTREAYRLMYPEHEIINDPTHGELVKLGAYANPGIDYFTNAASESSFDKFMGGGGALTIPLIAAGVFDPSGLAGAFGMGGGSAAGAGTGLGEAYATAGGAMDMMGSVGVPGLGVEGMGAAAATTGSASLPFDGWDMFDEGLTTAASETAASSFPMPPASVPFGPPSGIGGTDAVFGLPEVASVLGPPGASGGSLLDTVINWAEKHPVLTSAGLNIAGGIIKGAMTPSPEEVFREKAKAELDAQRQLLDQKRAFGQIRNIDVSRLRPTGRFLRKPGELPPGLVARAMR